MTISNLLKVFAAKKINLWGLEVPLLALIAVGVVVLLLLILTGGGSTDSSWINPSGDA